MAKKQNKYIDKEKFYEAMVDYRKKCREAEECGDDPPKINDYIGKCIYEIATRLSTRPNFRNYPFREELVGDGIENAIKSVDNFDPDKSPNPFGYFTQVIWFAFLRRIEKEKKLLYTKHKIMERNMINYSLHHDGESQIVPTEYMNDFVKTFEESMETKKKNIAKKKGLENFVEDDK